ncbi:MAG TPA: glycoside hydrolase family 88 protein [Vicinamibacterales bacterium]
MKNIALSLMAAAALAATQTVPQSTKGTDVQAVAAIPGEPSAVGAAGLALNDEPVVTLENGAAFDPASGVRRVVIVGGPGGEDAVIDLVRWFKRSSSSRLRRDWNLSALPRATALPGSAERSLNESLERWITFQAPDVLVEVRDDGRLIGLPSIRSQAIKPGDDPAVLERILDEATRGSSDLHEMIIGRTSRRAFDVALLLARRYPGTPAISYIPAVAWTNTLKLSEIAEDRSLAAKVRQQTEPWTSGRQQLFSDRILLTSIAGTMVFADLGGDARRLAEQGAKLAAATKDTGIAEYGQGWTDDMFMSSAILARMGEFDTAAQRLTSYASRLQRQDGIFIHATDGPFAWGRGNGFAALGLVELLTSLPEAHPARAALLDIYRRHMAAVRLQQSPDGMWREVLDEPGAYREETATAMLLTAMARGIRLGWIGGDYDKTVDRAWLGLLAHIKDDGAVIDVCTGTGAGPTKRYYLDRAALTGADDRGGAMALLASMEMIALRGR